MSTVDPVPLGVPFLAGEVLMQALRNAPTLEGCTFFDNPVRASDLEDGSRVVFLEDVSDGPAQQGEQKRREFRFNVGVINRTKAARAGVHTDYRAAKRVLNESIPLLEGIATVAWLREGDLTFRLEGVDVGGGLILAAFTLGYRDPGFRA